MNYMLTTKHESRYEKIKIKLHVIGYLQLVILFDLSVDAS